MNQLKGLSLQSASILLRSLNTEKEYVGKLVAISAKFNDLDGDHEGLVSEIETIDYLRSQLNRIIENELN